MVDTLTEATPQGEGTGRSPPVVPQAGRDYWEDEDRIRDMLQMCFDKGIYPTEIDPVEMIMEEREVRFKLNVSLDEIKVKWLKERTVTVIYKDAARFLPKNIKDDLVRAFEDGWVIGNENLGGNVRRGRVKIEGPGVASYVAKAREVVEFMLAEGQVDIKIGADTYKILLKPWMTRAEFRDLRRRGRERVLGIQRQSSLLPFERKKRSKKAPRVTKEKTSGKKVRKATKYSGKRTKPPKKEAIASIVRGSRAKKKKKKTKEKRRTKKDLRNRSGKLCRKKRCARARRLKIRRRPAKEKKSRQGGGN
ncbi:hypothetical protein CBR_g74673 [Chara braunii]|uniref:Uncharacterized protein n=1 Tax=Chara braunii TaxID=69332 RepID=A0A388KAD6_CHABU|nr:hypothetical protein CBR_g74673 [Chara braunii]|eukprot:GBG66987.1 hypothetical protein CBR_g74673 [Chara braunii]